MSIFRGERRLNDCTLRPTEPKNSGSRNPARRLQLNRHLPVALGLSEDSTDQENWDGQQTVRPSIRPPPRDSALKQLIRKLFPVEAFHALQKSQMLNIPFQSIKVPQNLEKGPTESVALLIVTFVNEIHTKVDAANLFYEKFLDLIEISLDTDDFTSGCPSEVILHEQDEHDKEQILYLIEIADGLLKKQLNDIL
jgi:hypothetical protein